MHESLSSGGFEREDAAVVGHHIPHVLVGIDKQMMGGIAFPQHGVIAACAGTWGDVDAGIPDTFGGSLVCHGLSGGPDHAAGEFDGAIETIFEIPEHPDHPAELYPIVISIAMAVHIGYHVQH